VRSKSDPPLDRFDAQRLPDLLRVYLELNRLKQLYRRGWLERGLAPERCESVAEHSFGVALLALLVADAHHPELNRERLLRMALLHDFGEIHAGDLTPADGVPPAEKRRREAASVHRVLGRLPGGARYEELWREYEEGNTPEARLLRQLDRLEMGLQALIYEREGQLDASDFLESVRRALEGGELEPWVSSIDELRDRASGTE
jgi:putative hydrolase of HD superfamily